jgi:ATP-dependent DNA helicase RecG
LELSTLGDLLLHRPSRYEDRRHFSKIQSLELLAPAQVLGKIVDLGVKRFRQGSKFVFEIVLDDGTGHLHCRWWNIPHMDRRFHVGEEWLVFGKPKSLKPPTIDHPETERVEESREDTIHMSRIVPVYPLTEGLPQRWLRRLLWRWVMESPLPWLDPHPELPMPEYPSRADAIRFLHFPDSLSQAELARQRLALDELTEFQISIQTRRRNLQVKTRGHACAGNNKLIKPWLRQLGYVLTGAQTRVLKSFRHEMAGASQPMRRLLQGDVGSGKTVVAAACALMAVECGFNAALMAPTEILAEQHFRTFTRWFAPLGVPVLLRTGTVKTEANSATPSLVVGTHALIESSFVMDHLGLVIIDEQHKFGVTQREDLVRKGHFPHLLVMTATPIPRTLALTLYGDLDLSILDEMPPGRGKITTHVRSPDCLPKVWEFIRKTIEQGRQAYIVYPAIEQSEKVGLKGLLQEYDKLQQTLAPLAVGLVHGRLKSEEKERVMAAFRQGSLQALMATSVIEVGVDIPNATVMVVENADRFGLAQLHQLRGRIGRGAINSHCILVAGIKTEEARRRLDVLAQTNDGFRIAEADLVQRGAGELLGQRQSGLPPFHFADFSKDLGLVELARQRAAKALITM